MSEKVIEKLDEIAKQQVEAVEAVKTEVDAKIVEAKTEFDEKVAALEAKVASIKESAPIIKTYKSIASERNVAIAQQLKEFAEKGGKVQKEVKLFEDESQYDAFLKEASSLTGSGYDKGGRTAYDPFFTTLRLINPMRGVSRNVATDGSVYQFRARVGNSGLGWGYDINNNRTPENTENSNIWQLVLKDLNVQFPVRTAFLDDADGYESTLVFDIMQEFSQAEGLSMIQNNDQGVSTLPYGGSNGLRGLNQYPGANGSYAGGTTSVAAFGSSGTATTDGLHDIATYDQLTTNGNGSVNHVTYADVVNFIYALPQQYWTPTAKFVVGPLMLAAIRGLTDDNGRPIYIDGLSRDDGIVGTLLGFDVVVNKYLDVPAISSGSAGTDSLYPMYFGDWQKAHTIVDRLNMILRRYDQTLPGSITFYAEKRLATSIVDPLSLVRYRSTATAVKP